MPYGIPFRPSSHATVEVGLDLEECPLIVMECSLLGPIYQGLSLAAAEKICRLREVCTTFLGTFSLFWHNSYFPESLTHNSLK